MPRLLPLAVALASAFPAVLASAPVLAEPQVRDLKSWDGRAAFFVAAVGSPVVVLAQAPSGAGRFRAWGVDRKSGAVVFVAEGSVARDFKRFLAGAQRELAARPAAPCGAIVGSPSRPLAAGHGVSSKDWGGAGQIVQPTEGTGGPSGRPDQGEHKGAEKRDENARVVAFARALTRECGALYAPQPSHSPPPAAPPKGRIVIPPKK